jgi:hypothetical protein
MGAKTCNGKDEKQIPFGDDNQRDKQRQKQATTKACSGKDEKQSPFGMTTKETCNGKNGQR